MKNDHTILVVDDEKNIAKSIQRSLKDEGFNVRVASSAEEGLKIMKGEKVALVISDYRMPSMDGIEFLQKVKNDWQDAIRVMLTAYNDMGVVVQAVNKVEVYRFVCKPWKKEELTAIVSGAINFYGLVQENRRLTEVTKRQNEQLTYLNQNLEIKVAEQTDHIRSIFLRAIASLVNALESKDKYTEGHSLRVSRLAASIAKILPMPEEEVESTRHAGLLHDVGKIGIREVILQKPGKLTTEEINHIRTHPVISEYILKPVINDNEIISVIRHHHEHYDGNGYPDGIAGEQIPMGARILSVVDAYDAVTSARPYSKARPRDEAIEEIKRCAGTQFDPVVVEAFIKAIE